MGQVVSSCDTGFIEPYVAWRPFLPDAFEKKQVEDINHKESEKD